MDVTSGGPSQVSLLIVGPALYLVAQIVGPDTDDSNKSKELANIAAHKGAYMWSGVIFFIAALVTVVSMVGVIHLFRGRRVTLGQVAGGLLLLGNHRDRGLLRLHDGGVRD